MAISIKMGYEASELASSQITVNCQALQAECLNNYGTIRAESEISIPSFSGSCNMDAYPPDSYLWEFIAYCAGTGGSMLIIGTAAGVAVMGIEKIDFFWYLKRIGWLAALGFLAGAGVYILQAYLIRL